MPVKSAWLAAWLALASCDAGKQHTQPTEGPAVHVVGASATVAADGEVEIAFDRILHPATLAADVVDGTGKILPTTLRYDPFTRVMSLRGEGAWLDAGATYHVKIHSPRTDVDQGLRAFDRAPLAADADIAFTAGAAANAVEPTIEFCKDVQPLFVAKCSGKGCHDSTVTPPITADGLVLTNPEGIAHTAVSRSSIESNKGLYAGSGFPQGKIFGIDMPIIDPKNPANSWITYKIAMTPPATAPDDTVAASACGNPVVVTPSPLAKPISDDERERLGNFVEGQAMPYPSYKPDGGATYNPFGPSELERVRLWIEQGAVVRDCACN